MAKLSSQINLGRPAKIEFIEGNLPSHNDAFERLTVRL